MRGGRRAGARHSGIGAGDGGAAGTEGGKCLEKTGGGGRGRQPGAGVWGRAASPARIGSRRSLAPGLRRGVCAAGAAEETERLALRGRAAAARPSRAACEAKPSLY